MSIINTTLNNRGYAIYKKVPTGRFYALASSLGEIVDETDVHITPGKPQMVYSSTAMPFHNDQPEVDIMAWRCEVPGTPIIPTLISRWKDCESAFSPREKEFLKSCAVHFMLKNKIQVSTIIDENNGIFLWPPGLKPEVADNPTIRKLLVMLKTQAKVAKLQQGDVLIINNKTVCHARPSLGKNKNRHLKRLWIKK